MLRLRRVLTQDYSSAMSYKETSPFPSNIAQCWGFYGKALPFVFFYSPYTALLLIEAFTPKRKTRKSSHFTWFNYGKGYSCPLDDQTWRVNHVPNGENAIIFKPQF